MPAESISINLIGKEDLSQTPQGRIVSWALTYGRYIMVGTEIVVLLAFLSRFSLDRKLTDLNDEIAQKQAIITANAPLENQVRLIQDSTQKIKTLLSNQSQPLDTLNLFSSFLPPDVYLKGVTIDETKVDGEAVAGTTAGFNQFLTNLQNSKQFSRVGLGDVSRQTNKGIIFKFSIPLGKK